MAQTMSRFFLAMLIFIPISFFFALFTQDKLLIFATSSIALIPISRIMGFSTNQIVLQSNPAMGGLVNATFGNIMELIIAIFALSHGLLRVVQASIIGSIIGNILLLIGISVLFGGLKFKEQKFNTNSAGVSSTMLIIAVVGLAIPTVYSFMNPGSPHLQTISNAVVMVLAGTYLAGIVFAFFTHKYLFDSSDELKATKEKPAMGKGMAMIILTIATVVVTFESEFLVNQLEFIATNLGLTQTFIGVIIIAILTNIAEKANAVHFARENKIDLSLEIGLSSATQIALFVVPVLVIVSNFMNSGFSLVFSMFEVVSMFFAVMIINYLSSDGRCNWLEGIQLISVYLIIAIAFFFV
jgi:Ca2+:H+ antiporter